jgi:hypothetical protein
VTASSVPRAADAASVTPQITDEYMQQMLVTSRTYTAMLLRLTPNAAGAGAEHVIWEHGRRNFMLRAAGTLPIVCPATDDSDWAGVAIFDASPEEVDRIMADDPGIRAGVFTYELHPVCGFPGSALP